MSQAIHDPSARQGEEATKLYQVFTKVAIAEGISYLLLVFVAMPLKYFADLPLAVTYVGWAHGVLFVGYCAFLPVFFFDRDWRFWRTVRAFILALVPFGTFRKL